MRRAGLLLLVLVSALGCSDPVRDGSIDALGEEAPGVRQGPLHRPGQPCLLCHDGSVGSPEGFSVAGTVYQRRGSLEPANHVHVHLVDSSGSTFDATTNAAGNFYVLPSDWSPAYPLGTYVRATGGSGPVLMHTRAGRDGSCARCHFDPTGPTSPGHVYLELEDGSAPP